MQRKSVNCRLCAGPQLRKYWLMVISSWMVQRCSVDILSLRSQLIPCDFSSGWNAVFDSLEPDLELKTPEAFFEIEIARRFLMSNAAGFTYLIPSSEEVGFSGVATRCRQ
jgi:hypothetical protein